MVLYSTIDLTAACQSQPVNCCKYMVYIPYYLCYNKNNNKRKKGFFMNKKLNHKCKVCGAQYHACNDCDKNSKGVLSWRSLCDTEQHYKIYQIILWYCRGTIDESEAREMLNKCDLSDKGNYTESTLQLLDKIYYIPKENVRQVAEDSNGVDAEKKENTYTPRKKKPAQKVMQGKQII